MRLIIGISLGLAGGIYVQKRYPEKVNSLMEKLKVIKENPILEKNNLENKIKIGENSETIKNFQKELNLLFPQLKLTENGIYTEEMRKKLEFLSDANLFDSNKNLDKAFVININYTLGNLNEKNLAEIPTIKPNTLDTIEKGDKGKEVEKLQRIIRKLTGNQNLADDNLGAFTRDTAIEVAALFANTTVLIDSEKAKIDKAFVNNFYNLIF